VLEFFLLKEVIQTQASPLNQYIDPLKDDLQEIDNMQEIQAEEEGQTTVAREILGEQEIQEAPLKGLIQGQKIMAMAKGKED
jgi:hypothetical protein